MDKWDDIQILLKSANPCLSHVTFRCISRTQKDNGVQLGLSVRPRDRETLLKNGPEFKFGMGKTRIYEVSRSKESKPSEKKESEKLDEDFQSSNDDNTEATEDLETPRDDSYRNVDVTVIEQKAPEHVDDGISKPGSPTVAEESTTESALSDTPSVVLHGSEVMDFSVEALGSSGIK